MKLNKMAGILPLTESRDTSRSSKASTTLLEPNEPKILPFLKEDTYADTILVVEGRKLFTHRSLLSYASPNNLTKLLNSAHSAASAEKKNKAEIKMSEQNYADFVDLFSFIHPGVCKELTEKMALRLLPLADHFEMPAVKDRCERLLITLLKKTPISSKSKGVPANPANKREIAAPTFLLQCIKAADQGNSKKLLDECIRLYANPDIALRDLKASTEISAATKAKIFETRMDTASNKLSRMANDLDKEKYEKEQLKKQLADRFVQKQKTTQRYTSEPTIENPPHDLGVTSSLSHHKHQHNYLSHQRHFKYSENILGPVHEFSRDDFKQRKMSSRTMLRSEKGDI